MTELLHRANPTDLEVRTAGNGRTIVGIAVPFDRDAQINEFGQRYTERFARGAFARTIRERGPQRIKARALHQRTVFPIGRAQELREDAEGLYAELLVAKTLQGDEVLELVRNGALDSLSIGFEPVKGGDRWNTRHTEVTRTEVRLHEVSVVDSPAYADALISGVRGQLSSFITAETARSRLAIIERTSR